MGREIRKITEIEITSPRSKSPIEITEISRLTQALTHITDSYISDTDSYITIGEPMRLRI